MRSNQLFSPEELKKFNPFTNELDKLITNEKSIIEQLNHVGIN